MTIPRMERKCFLVAPIGKNDSDERKRTDRLEKYILQPILEPMNIEIIRADKIREFGMITNQIIDNLVRADLVIADLTGANANVFYELGIRHVLGTPILHIRFKNSPIPFDNADCRTISYYFEDNIEALKSELSESIEAAFAGSSKNPFTSFTDTFVVFRDQQSYFRKIYPQMRSLDTLTGKDNLVETIRDLLSLADEGFEFWFQSSLGTTYPENGGELFTEAFAKGASVRAVIADSPFARTMIHEFSQFKEKGFNIEFVTVKNIDIRLFGVNDILCLLAPPIDGFYGAYVCKDKPIVTAFRSIFQETFDGAKST